MVNKIKIAILRDLITRNGDVATGNLGEIAARFNLAWCNGAFVLVAKE